MNLSLIPSALDCLRKGSALTNPGLWKAGGIGLSAAIGAFALSLNSIGKAFGYDFAIDQPTADAIGAVAAWVVGTLCHVATTDKLGVLPAKSGAGAADEVGQSAPQGDAHVDAQVGGQPAEPATPDPMRVGGGNPDGAA